MALSSQRGLCLICHYAVQRDALDAVHGLLSGGCGDSSAEREFPSDKIYRRDDRGIVRVECLSLKGSAFVVVHTSVGRAACRYGSPSVHGPLVSEVLIALPLGFGWGDRILMP
jgi:hypothetical protein